MRRPFEVREPVVAPGAPGGLPAHRHGLAGARGVGALGLVVLVLAAAGCGGADPQGRRALDAFLNRTPLGRTLAKRFPHEPGGLPCTVVDPSLGKRVPATCATDVAVEPTRIVATFTESWSHGSQTHTWFVFLRRDGTVKSVRQEGVAGKG